MNCRTGNENGQGLLQQPLSFGRRERKASVDNFLRSV